MNECKDEQYRFAVKKVQTEFITNCKMFNYFKCRNLEYFTPFLNFENRSCRTSGGSELPLPLLAKIEKMTGGGNPESIVFLHHLRRLGLNLKHLKFYTAVTLHRK